MPAITNYTGDKNLGQGSNADIDVIAPESRGNKIIQDTSNRLMLMNHQNNVNMFEQKVRDRDTLYDMLNKGQVVVGDINPEDRPYYDKYKNAQDAAFYKLAESGGINNKDAYREYINSTNALKDVATHVQARKVAVDQYKKDIAAETIPARKEELQKQLQAQLDKGSGALIDPFQRSLDLDTDKIISSITKDSIFGGNMQPTATRQSVTVKDTPGKPPTTTTKTTTMPLKGHGAAQSVTKQMGEGVPQTTSVIYRNGLPYQVNRQYIDFNKIKQNANDIYLDKTGEGTAQLNSFYDALTDPNSISHPEIAHTYREMVKKAEDYNRARGFKPDEYGNYSDEDLTNGAADVNKLKNALSAPVDPKTGRRNINMSKPELAAYFSLAHLNNYATETESLLKDEATLELQNKKVAGELAIKSKEAASKAALRSAQIKKINKALEGKTPEQERQEFEKYWADNGAAVLNPVSTKDITNTSGDRIPFEQSRPVYTQGENGSPQILKPIGAETIYSAYNDKGNPLQNAKVVGYRGGSYETQFYNKSTGQTLQIDKIKDAFTQAKKNNPSLTNEQFITNLSNGGVTYRMIGADGKSANIDDNANNLRILNNRYKTKGEQDPISSDIDVDVFEQSNEE